MKKLSGFAIIVIATAIAGVAGYVITWLVPRAVGVADYTVFAIFWSFLFLIISGLSGMQQEVTRATRETATRGTGGLGRTQVVGAVFAAAVFLAIIGSAPAWVNQAFPTEGWRLVWPLAVGAASYVLVAVVYGSLYGISAWGPLFWMISVDALLRFMAILFLLLFTSNIVFLAWAVAIPFPATLILLAPLLKSRLSGKVSLDVGPGRLLWNIARTIVAAGSTGIMVSGFPLLLGLTAGGEPDDQLGLLILAITLTRAPLIVVVMALQSFLIVLFRNRSEGPWKTLIQIQGLIFGLGVLFAIAGWWAGPPVFAFLFPGELVPEGWLIAVLVVSSAFVGALCVSGAALLARAHHAAYSVGWLVAAVVTVLGLLLPLDFVARAVVALLVGPILGLVAHVGYLVAYRRSVSAPLRGELEQLPGE